MFSSSLPEFYADHVSDRSPGSSQGRSYSGDDSIMSDGSDCHGESSPAARSESASQSSHSSNEMESDDEQERESGMDTDDYHSYVPLLLHF